MHKCQASLVSICLLTAMLSGTSLAVASESTAVHVVGEARDLKSDKLLYTEEHVIDGTSHTVNYKDLSGEVFAEKTLSYDQGFFTPVYRLYDKRFSRESGSLWRNNKWFVYRVEKDGSRDELKMKKNSGLVIDAGFNGFIRAHFDEFNTEADMDFQFGLPDPLLQLSMHMRRVPCSDKHLHVDDEKLLCLRARTTNIIYRLFLVDIYVVYSRDTHYLMSFQGPSNLPSSDDGMQNVKITYRYEDEPVPAQ